jgi:hypothetical protein
VARQPGAIAEATLRCAHTKHGACQAVKPLIPGMTCERLRAAKMLHAEDLFVPKDKLTVF